MLEEGLKKLKERRAESHKGDYGHLFILGGSPGLTGAVSLSSRAALSFGAGLVTLGIPESLNTILEVKLTEVMTLPLPETKDSTISLEAITKIRDFSEKVDGFLIGPGISRQKETSELVRKLLPSLDKPVVLDADGLNAFSGYADSFKEIKVPLILTPHPKEMERLIGEKVVLEKREIIVKKFVDQYPLTLILKGHRTIVAKKDKFYLNLTGNPGMATAGSGDVLSGMVASLLVQGFEPFLASALSVYLHGLAGDLAAKEKTETSLIASDILDKLPAALKEVMGSGLVTPIYHGEDCRA